MANNCGRAAGGDDVGRERFAVLCRMLLMVFQRAGRLDEEDWTWLGVELLFGGGYKFMVAIGSRPKQFKVENRV